MVDRSSLSVIVLTCLVLALSFKDMILVKQGAVDEQTPAIQFEKELNNDAAVNKAFEGDQDDMDSFDNENANENENENTDLTEDKSAEFVKKIPSLKFKTNAPTLKVLYCYSCGYRNAFEQYSQMIKSRFPDINIIGENYSPAGYKLMIAQFFSTFKIILIGLVLSGQNPFTYLNMPTPNVFNWATQNKLYSCLMIFFISNAIETNLITSGAFEMYLNDMQIWSKLQSDRMPHEKELMQILDMNFNFESEKSAAFGGSNGKF